MSKIVAAFETWYNGGIQTSALYLASLDGQERVLDFIDGNTGSFAELHTFESEEEAIEAFASHS